MAEFKVSGSLGTITIDDEMIYEDCYNMVIEAGLPIIIEGFMETYIRETGSRPVTATEVYEALEIAFGPGLKSVQYNDQIEEKGDV